MSDEKTQVWRAYRKRDGNEVTAVQINISTPGIDYEKWDDRQHAKQGDWIVDNTGDVYTIDKDSFAATYEEVSPGRYHKVAMVYAREAGVQGRVKTKEGYTGYEPGDYLVSNSEDGSDCYAVEKYEFERMYEMVLEGVR